MSIVVAVGASSSIQEIDHEGVNLQLCRCCQEIIEKNKQRIGSGAKVEIPTSANRINRVLKFMDNYLPRIDVQVAALNAVINFSRNADAPVCARDTDIVTVVSKSLLTHLGEFSIVWRACMAFALLANHHGELAVDIALTNVHENMVDKFPSYIEEPIVQQQVLWLFAALVSWPRSHRLLHKSQKCMTFIVDLIKAADDLEKQKEIVVVDEPELQPKKSMKISMLSLKREVCACMNFLFYPICS